MSKAYDEIMERIAVNDDMRRRVLQNVEKEPANNVELQEDSAVWLSLIHISEPTRH